MATINNKNEKQITEASASVCLLLATALDSLIKVYRSTLELLVYVTHERQRCNLKSVVSNKVLF